MCEGVGGEDVLPDGQNENFSDPAGADSMVSDGEASGTDDLEARSFWDELCDECNNPGAAGSDRESGHHRDHGTGSDVSKGLCPPWYWY